MYAIVTTGGKQYKVATDDVLNVEKIDGEVGTKVTLPVVFLNDGKKIVTDPAKLAKAKVTAEIVEQDVYKRQPLASVRLRISRLRSVLPFRCAMSSMSRSMVAT